MISKKIFSTLNSNLKIALNLIILSGFLSGSLSFAAADPALTTTQANPNPPASLPLATANPTPAPALAPVSTDSAAATQNSNLPINQIVAIVNNGIITQSQLETAVNFEKMQADAAGVTGLPDELSLQKQALQGLITQTTALQLANRNNITVQSQALDQAIQSISGKMQKTPDQFTIYLKKFDLTDEDYRTFIQNQLIIRSLAEQAIASNITVTPDEINTYIAQEKQLTSSDVTYHVAHILISLPENPSPTDIQTAKNKAEHIAAEIKQGMDFSTAAIKYSASQDAATGGDLGEQPLNMLPLIFIGPVQSLNPGEVSSPIQSASGFHLVKLISEKSATPLIHYITQYQIKQILINTSPILSSSQAKTILDHLRLELINGKSFDVLARENSQDTLSAAQGGTLNWASLENLGPYYASVINGLKPGEISEPFPFKNSWILIKLINSRQYDDTANFARQEASNAIFQKKAMEAVNTWEAELRGESYVRILVPSLNLDSDSDS
jgi:peptidyl-prolyl cis-trans isomerase SurA